jgi:hypothetical protein
VVSDRLRWRANPVAALDDQQRVDLLQLLGRMVCRTPAGCLEWRGKVTAAGYARVVFHGRLTFVHRLVVAAGGRTLSRTDTVDHTCHNTRCLNARHLRVVGISENCADNGNARKRRCRHGHSLRDAIVVTQRRTWRYADGTTRTKTYRGRRCRSCYVKFCKRAAMRIAA